MNKRKSKCGRIDQIWKNCIPFLPVNQPWIDPLIAQKVPEYKLFDERHQKYTEYEYQRFMIVPIPGKFAPRFLFCEIHREQ